MKESVFLKKTVEAQETILTALGANVEGGCSLKISSGNTEEEVQLNFKLTNVIDNINEKHAVDSSIELKFIKVEKEWWMYIFKGLKFCNPYEEVVSFEKYCISEIERVKNLFANHLEYNFCN